jgi:SAM-dependent methyltransferase
MSADPVLKSQIRDWWAGAPMTYGEQHGSTDYVRADGGVERVVLGSKRFFELADQRFYAWNTPLHTGRGRFARIFPYDGYRGRDVLEVGCGMGCMAMNWALNGAAITAVDLNPVAIAQTRQRFAVHQLAGTIHEADAEALPFPDASFDFVYSWGVLHHTPLTADALREIHRVLKPGGGLGVMLYHRKSLLYRYTVAFIEGWLNMERDFLDELGLASRYGDGGREEGNPHTWPVTRKEVRRDLFSPFENVSIETLGTDIPDLLNTLLPSFADRFTPAMKSALARRLGWSLWITGDKGRT